MLRSQTDNNCYDGLKRPSRPQRVEPSIALYLACPCAIIAPVIVGSGLDFFLLPAWAVS